MPAEILAIIPTFNEEEFLSGTISSVLSQDASVDILVVNAGEPLSPALASQVRELQVDPSFFWTACVEKGVAVAKTDGYRYVLLLNADSESVPGSIELLYTLAQHSQTIACSVAYEPSPAGGLRLQYSRQVDLGLLLYGKISRDWESASDAPTKPFETDLLGGQGILIPICAFDEVELDPVRFPQYAGDHDLWLSLRKQGWKLWVHPQAAIVNQRQFNKQKRRGLLRTLAWRVSSEFAPESARIMWRLRRKHLGGLRAVISFVGAFGLRWTVGLPKIIERSR